MSFGGGGGGGFSFGSSNNTQNTGFGGFGSNTNTSTGFGTNTSSTGFGSSTATANPFGGSTFGSNSGGFGGNTNTSGSLFGNKPASNPFGSTTTNTGGGLFGSSTTNTGFGSGGGFGSTNNAFGGGNTGSSGFSFGGASKPGFGASTNSTPLFGQGGAGTTGGFGSTSSPFGAGGTGTALSNQPVPPSDGTASTPYAPTLEKEAAGLSSNYQSINFMPPYQKYSFEELRLADYNAGRKYGNTTGQAGGFGPNTFGGFGASNSGFGANANTNPFGPTTTTTSTGFGSNTATTGFGGGGLFANKPAGGTVFGQQSSAASSGGLFGTSNNSTNAFGGGSAGFGAGGGIFGQNQNQNKPSLFGNTSSTPSSFSFGNTNNANTGTGGGLFNTNPGTPNTGGFGGNQQQPGGLFGTAQNQQPKPSLFGTGFGTSTNQNQQSTGLFNTNANTNTGTSGGLFNTNANTNSGTGGGLFGTNPSLSGNTLFGNTANNQQKPGGIFGTSTFGNTGTNTGGGLFGTSNNQQQPGGLFTNTNTNTGSGFSFGNTANKPATGSLFNTNPQQGGFGGSTSGFGGLFGNSQNNQQNQQQPDFKISSLNDPNPYGQTSIWTGLPVPTPDNSKPLFTPLSATQKLKESQSKPPPSLRLNQSRYMTPPRRSGFGFSYSTYGTPNSAASTPGGSGLSSSMYGSRSFNGGSFGRSFGKSASASNLRSQFAGDGDGVLSPNAFASTNTRWSSGNMRRLTIDRSIRNDLFSRPSLPAFPTNALNQSVNGNNEVSIVTNGESSSTSEPTSKLKKRVSFDKDTAGGSNGVLNGESGALVRTESDQDELDGVTAGRTVNGTATPEAEPVRGNELAVVPEDRESDDLISRKATVQAKPDPQPGDYWMKPTRAELSKMPREKLSRFVGFEVGRKGCGKVVFNGPVDLTSIPLDDLYEKIVEIRLRSVTVYPDASSKPPVGKGLNVPSTISIENSWPRSRGQPSSATSGPIFEKHVNRLKKMHGTEFVNYEVTTGVWTFRVPHYTRYGLDYDDDELGQSMLSAPPDSFNSSRSTENSGMDVDSEAHDDYEVDGNDDTFAFKQKTLPGGYGRESIVDYGDDVPAAQTIEEGAESSDLEEDYSDDGDNEVSMAGSYPPPTASPSKPILKPSTVGTPGKTLINIDGDWAEQLQRTISPRKQNRDALRQVQSKVLLDRTYEPMKPSHDFSKNVNKREFRTSIDIMNSLFSRHEERMAELKGKKGKPQAGPDFEFPYAKRAKTFEDQVRQDSAELGENDKVWHASFKPNFTSINQLVYKSVDASGESDWVTEVLAHREATGRDVVMASLEPVNIENAASYVKSILTHAQVVLADNVPSIKRGAVTFSQLKDHLLQQRCAPEELEIYELLHVLFDEYEDEFTNGLHRQQQREFLLRIRRDRLSKYLSELIWRRHGLRIKEASKLNGATAAVMQLTANSIHAACDALMQENDFHLALLVAQLGQADSAFQGDIADQISAWRGQGVISEMSEEIRALYEILSGNTSIAQGKQNVPVEDRASTFAISEKFGLDWIQAFALCFWYGKHKNGEIYEVVADFQEKLNSKLESATPVCGHNEDEDPLWVVLKIFASNTGSTKGRASSKPNASFTSQVEKPVLPQALSALSRPWDSWGTFRLHHAIIAAIPGVAIDQDRSDDLAASLAFEHSARRNTLGAVYALLHLSDPAQRAAQIRDLFNRHAATLPCAPSTGDATASQDSLLWTAFTASLQVPAPWIHQSKALYARSCNNPVAELNYLLAAADFCSAHDCFLRRVAPRLVIDEDWETLRRVLGWFGHDAEKKVDVAVASNESGTEWKNGGQVYSDFVELMSLMDKSKSPRRDSADSRAKTALLSRLQGSLTDLNVQSQKTAGSSCLNKDREKLEERVALCEMGKMVARVLEFEIEDGLGEKSRILELPLHADARLVHAQILGVEYYRRVMAMAR